MAKKNKIDLPSENENENENDNSELKDQLIKHIKESDINIDELVKNISNISLHEKNEEIGKAEYLEACDRLNIKNGELVYFRGIRSYTVTKNKFRYFLGENSYDMRTLKIMLNGIERAENLVKYCLKHHNMKSQPILHKYCYITNPTAQEECGFRFRKDLEIYKNDFDKWTALASTMTSVFDKDTHSYNCYIPLIQRIKSDNKMINNYLKMTFKEDLFAIMDYLSLYTFENRYEISRPTLLMVGERGTGKNTFVEALMSRIYFGVSSEITFGDSFTEWGDSKLAYIGEISSEGHNTSYLWDFSKQISGQAVNKVNTKYGAKNDASNGLFFIMMSNEPKPVHIKDPILNEEENQMLVIKLNKSEKTDSDIRKFKLEINRKGYLTIADFFMDHLGHWIYTDLFNHYKELRMRIKYRPCRYGMVVPITQGLKDIIQMSISGNDASIMKFIEDLFYQNNEAYKLDEEEEIIFRMFISGTKGGIKGFIPISIIQKIPKSEKFDFFTLNRFLRKKEWLITNNIRVDAIDNTKSRNGIIVNVNKIAKYIKEQSDEADRQIVIYQENNEFEGNFVAARYAELKEPDIEERNLEEEMKEIHELL